MLRAPARGNRELRAGSPSAEPAHPELHSLIQVNLLICTQVEEKRYFIAGLLAGRGPSDLAVGQALAELRMPRTETLCADSRPRAPRWRCDPGAGAPATRPAAGRKAVLPSRNRPRGPRLPRRRVARSRNLGGRFELAPTVEAGGIEPPSESTRSKASTRLAHLLSSSRGRR